MILFLLLISHLVGDFVLQTSNMATKKKKQRKVLFLHGLIYSLPFALILFSTSGFMGMLFSFLIIVFSHILIDLVRIKIDEGGDKCIKLASYFVDQVLHIAIILFVYYFFGFQNRSNYILQFLDSRIVIYALIYLILLQPAAVTVKKVLDFFELEEDNQEDCPSGKVNGGYLIGILERIIVATFVLQGQFSAIAFVLTAKSLARFKNFEKQDFAEKYLIGTLLSVTIAIMVTVLLKPLI